MSARDWPDDDQAAGWRLRTLTVAVLGLLLAAAGAAVFADLRTTTSAAPDASLAPVTGSSGLLPAADTDLAVRVGVAEPVEPLLTAPSVEWELVSGVAVPVSRSAGPRDVDGPVHGGFARSQTGGLVAAMQLSTRYALTPQDGWREVVERQVLPGVGRDVYTRRRALVVLDDPPGSYGQFAGFRVVTFTRDVMVVQLVSRFSPAGRLQVVAVTVKWVQGDWRLELQPDGAVSATVQPVADLDGFVLWGGA